jgi:hypothetical protein
VKSALAFPLLVSGLVACCTRTGPDVAPVPMPQSSSVDTLPQPASLVRRLAEAADGYRDGKDKWVVASRRAEKGNHAVLGVFSSSEEAELVARRGGGDFAVFGPFRTPKDDYRIPEGERVAEVVVRYVNRTERRYSPDSVDAVFWGLPAFDKFIVPYLSSIASAEYAAEQRELYRLGQSKLAGSEPVAHKKGSF